MAYPGEMPAGEELLRREDEILKTLLEAASYKDDESLWRKVEIRRGGRTLFSFRIRPLGEEETQEMREKCARKGPDPRGPMFPRIELQVDFVRLRSMKIYEATVPEDRARLWDDRAAQTRLNCLDPIGVIEQVLLAGEKDALIEQIDAISGFGAPLEELAKN